MLYCEDCNVFLDDEEDINHLVKYHRQELIKVLEDFIYEWDGCNTQEEALTVGERNPTLK